MSGMLSGRSIFGNQPNVLFDASNYGRGQNDALAIQKNKLMLDRAQMENANDQAFRSAAPGAIGGDPAAMTAAVAADPDRALALQTQLAGLDAGRRKKALESMTILGQGTAALLGLPEDEAARQYPGMIAGFKARGIDVSSLPPAYPGHAAARAFAASLSPIKDSLERYDQEIVAAPGGSYADRVHGYENGTGNPDARNPRSTARGNGQFIDGTWQDFIRENPTLFQGMTPEQAMAARADPGLSRKATDWYAAKNSPVLSQAGFEPSEGNLYLAHRLGPKGSVIVLGAAQQNPNTPLASILPEEVIRANPDLAGKTAGGMVTEAARRFPPRQMVERGTGKPVTMGGAAYVQNQDGSTGFQPLPDRQASDGRLPPGVMIGPDGRRTKDDAYIQAQREIAAGKAEATPPKRIPATIQKMDDEDITAIQTARSLEKDISDLGAMLDDKKFSTGFVDRLGYSAAGALNMSGPEGRDFATFKATVEKIRNDSLRLNKGVQTEGDAVRAGNELMANINDTATVRQRLQELAAINQRAAGLTALKLNRRRVENGLPEIDEAQIVNAPSVLSGAPKADGAPGAKLRFNPQTGKIE